MSIRYKSLFSVTIAHTYFTSGFCEDLTYENDLATQNIMNNYGFILKKIPIGFEVYTITNQSIEEHLNYIKQVTGITAFKFLGTATNSNFYNYTAEVSIKNIGILSYGNTETLSTQLEGTFVLKNDSQNALEIKINFDDIIELTKQNNTAPFQIQLEARKTQWRYYIINNSNQNFEQLAIEVENSEIQFSQSKEVTIQNGQKALLFSSGTHKIPLKKKPDNTFNLINTKTTIAGNRKETVFKGLPIPNTENLQILDDDTIASLMYVYI